MLLQIQGLHHAYDGREAVRGVDVSLARGAIGCLLGPSGCGKTTVLRCIAGFERVSAGRILLNGALVSGPGAMVPPEARRIGMVFQDYALFPHLTVEKNIAFGLRGASAAARVRELAELTRLDEVLERYPHELSGGQQQRVALARALAHNPVILLLDEPFSNLDPDMATHMRQELHALLKRTNTTTILVTHDHDEAFAIADRIAVLNQGRLEQLDTPEMIYHMPATPFVADFVGQADFIPGVVQQGVVVTELGSFPIQKSLAVGTSVVMMIRPDDVRVSSAEGGDAVIVGRQFRGSENLYRIRLRSGRMVHCSEASTAVYPVGAKVTLTVYASHTVVFPDGGTGLRSGTVSTPLSAEAPLAPPAPGTLPSAG